MSYTIDKIRQEMTSDGSHWWDRDSMRFFRTRVCEQCYQGPGGIYFVTSECSGSDSPRMYSVRQYMPRTRDIDTIGEFNSMTRSRAHRLAAKMAATEVVDQMLDAVHALNMAVLGQPTAEPWFAIKPYEGSSGFYLELIEEWPEGDPRLVAWRKSFKLQQEVARAKQTEPAGESVVVVKEAVRDVTAAEQLVIDIKRNGGLANLDEATRLIELAKRHHKMMEDDCNGVFQAWDENEEMSPELAQLRNEIGNIATLCMCGVKFSGDPRGATVKLIMPSGETNDWGKEGWVVPTH